VREEAVVDKGMKKGQLAYSPPNPMSVIEAAVAFAQPVHVAVKEYPKPAG
jgi:hypothetical protein